MEAADVLKFWFEEIDESSWWKKDPDFDKRVAERFFDLHTLAKQSALFSWRQTPEGRLAEIIVLDQFSRNMFRDQPQAFAQDPLALALSQEAVNQGLHKKLKGSKRFFMIMPYMHSESIDVHNEALPLFEALDGDNSADFEKKHRDIIVRFGRYPHRNEILGRTSTAEELEFLKGPNSSF